MTKYKTHLNTDELSNYVDSIPSSQLIILPHNKIYHAKIEGNIITLKGVFFKTEGVIIDGEEYLVIKTQTKFRRYLYALIVFPCVFFFLILFSEKATLNGISDPGFFERIKFLLSGILLLSIPLGISVKLKSDFEKTVVSDLKLKSL